jgi:intein/homing endonuclease
MVEKEERSHKEQRVRSITHLYYSKPNILKAIFKFSQDREISPRFYEGFGKRPDAFQYESDIYELVKRGATSFHCSEELWSDPLSIQTGMPENKLKELRIGWDLLIDIDCKWIDFSKKAAQAVVKTLKDHGIKNIGTKFSVSGDTPILIKERNNISLISISEAVDLSKKEKNLEVLSLDKNRKLKFSKIYDYLEHQDTIYEIIHSQSTLPLNITKHHSVFIWDNGDIVEKKVSEIKEGDFLISFNSKEENPFSLEDIEIINRFEFASNKFTKKNFETKINLTSGLMRLIGYFLAEGHVTNIINQVGFSFNKKELDYIEDVKLLLKEITGKKISIRHPNEGSTQILIHSKEWATFFDNFCGKKKNKHPPNFCWNLKKELFLEMLKGYINGDGYKIGEYGVVIKSVSKKLTTEMLWLCKLNGISANISKEQGKPHTLPQGNIFKGSLVYMLRIPKSELEKVGFYRKRNKFSPFPGDKIFPIDGLKRVYSQINPKKFNSHRAEQMTLTKEKANLNRIRKVLDWFYDFSERTPDDVSKRILENYEKLFKSDISVVKIKKIVKKEKELVYDISVDETESFFGNYYPILLHNSGSKGFHILVPWKAFPKIINGVETKNLFPELPRKLVAFLRSESEKNLRNILPKDFAKQFASTNLAKGTKCSVCREIASKRVVAKFICPRCNADEVRHLKSTQIPLLQCPKCRVDYNVLKKEYFFCENCKISSLTSPENFKLEEHDLYELMGLDMILVSPRHLFRMPYSLHEKTALASVVLNEEELENFQITDANPLSVKVKDYMPGAEESEAKEFVIRALDWYQENKPDEDIPYSEKSQSSEFQPIKIANLSDKLFPPSIKKILEGVGDGRKRAAFILINYFRSVGMEKLELEKRVYEWNEKNEIPLKQGYIKSQIQWSYRNKIVPPPNFDKDYYKGIGVIPTEEELRFKNPINYTLKKFSNENDKNNKPKKNYSKKKLTKNPK